MNRITLPLSVSVFGQLDAFFANANFLIFFFFFFFLADDLFFIIY